MPKLAISSIRRKKVRAEQVRDAQRRRRERLRSENLGFLQLILPETFRDRLLEAAQEAHKTLQEMALTLIAEALGESQLIESIPIRKADSKLEKNNDASSVSKPADQATSAPEPIVNKSPETAFEADESILSAVIPEEESEVSDNDIEVEQYSQHVEVEYVEPDPADDVSHDYDPDSEFSASHVPEAANDEVASEPLQDSEPSHEEKPAEPVKAVKKKSGGKRGPTDQMELF